MSPPAVNTFCAGYESDCARKKGGSGDEGKDRSSNKTKRTPSTVIR